MRFPQLSAEQLEALRTMSNVGMEHAATALSQFMGRTIHLRVQEVHAMNVGQIPAFLGREQHLVIGVYLRVLGDATGNILIIFTREDAMRMLDNLLPLERHGRSLLTELEASALKEVGNILASAFLNALGSRLGMMLLPSVPVLSFDMTGAVADFVITEAAGEGDPSFIIETQFSEECDNFRGNFFLLPDHASIGAMLGKIEV